MKTFQYILAVALLLSTACKKNEHPYDASGVFEAEEIIVSSEIGGKILSMPIEEGSQVQKDSVTVVVDAGNLALQQQQVEASIQSLNEKTVNVGPQVQLLQNQLAVQQTQLQTLQQEEARFAKLVAADAATPKQLDDIRAQAETLRKQMNVTRQQIVVQQSQTSTQNRSILSEKQPLRKRSDIIADQVKKGQVVNPVNGTVLTKYAYEGEVTAPGKALYKVADLRSLTLRAYVTGNQLSQIKIGQPVTVQIDQGEKGYKPYSGTITWISDKAEFTPKTIQTKEERANLVYAVKMKVPNDGLLKIGMFGEVLFSGNQTK